MRGLAHSVTPLRWRRSEARGAFVTGLASTLARQKNPGRASKVMAQLESPGCPEASVQEAGGVVGGAFVV